MDAETFAPPSAPPAGVAIKTEIVVIGAGQAGLSSAYHLRQRGLEAGSRLRRARPVAEGGWGLAVPLAVADAQHGQPSARPAGDGVLRGGRYQQRRSRGGGRRAALLRSLRGEASGSTSTGRSR